MDLDAAGPGAIGAAVGYAFGAFAAVSLAISKALGDKKGESVQIAFYKDRAETAEKKYNDTFERLNGMADQLSELKTQYAVTNEQLRQVREENAELAEQVRKFMESQK